MTQNWLVAVPRPLHYLLTYSADTVPTAPGCRVQVPLGYGRASGIVVAPGPVAETSYRVKPVSAAIDTPEQPLLDAHLLELLHWAAQYYQHPPGEVFFNAIPTALRGGKALPEQEYWQACRTDNAVVLLKGARRQQEMYQWMLAQGRRPLSADQLCEQFGGYWRRYLQGLLDKGLLEKTLSITPDVAGAGGAETDTELNTGLLSLTPQQQACLEQCQVWMSAKQPKPILLYGVTGSGKTEIYLRLLQPVLEQGRQALVLVPEIGLTPQLLERFQAFFPAVNLVTLHSGLSAGERLSAWMQARSEQAQLIVGTRSAVFTPCPGLGIIVVDEEHDLSFKQQEGFHYHGRDLAIKRAQLLNIPILLGSATPALESLHNADQERYHYTELAQRPGERRPPQWLVQDIRGVELQAGLSGHSLQLMRETLQRNEQVMVFINRRGFAPVLLCQSCGWQAQCPACSSNMTFHSRGSRLICHHCGTERQADQYCPDCNNPRLSTQGQGTERIELMLKQHFTETEVVRIDRDSTRRKGELPQQLQLIQSGQRLLMVGTQMLAKGHDFPNLTLVVILDIDQALLSAEYHALERFGQLLVQVSGRAGRASKPGQVILQTTQPQHPVLLTLLESGYLSFARQLLSERQRWQYPPFAYQALIRANGTDLEATLACLASIRSIILEHAGVETAVQLLGPVPAPMEKRAGRYRAQLLIQSKQRRMRHYVLQLLVGEEKNILNRRGVRWSIDVDPVELS